MRNLIGGGTRLVDSWSYECCLEWRGAVSASAELEKMKSGFFTRFRKEWMVSIAVGLSYAVFLCVAAPLGTAFQFGESEGYELIKGYLCSLGYELYGSIWNDQPPFHTGLLCLLFKWFGPSLLAARLLAVGFAALLIGIVYELARRSAGHWGGITAAVVLLAWSVFMRLSVSVMLDPAAMALALLSSLLLLVALDKRGSGRALNERRDAANIGILAASGMVMGLALQTKLTAVMFLPAIVLEFLRSAGLSDEKQNNIALRHIISGRFWLPVLGWTMAMAVGVVAVWLFFPSESLDDLLRSHFSRDTIVALGGRHGFELKAVSREWIFIAPATVSAIWILVNRESKWVFPLILFLTVCVVHLFQRPFWFYYTLHFAIPTAWLAGIFVGAVWKRIWSISPDLISGRPKASLSGIAACSVVVGLLATSVLVRLGWAWRSISEAELLVQNPVVREINRHSKNALWVFSDNAIYAFHARKPMPPEIAVIPEKRFWSSQTSVVDIRNVVQQYRPGIVYVHLPALRRELETLLRKEYRETATDGVFIRTDLAL
jgi:4-amino-4-deoxy-L-arabinose transferase-like glycosyltransferase